MNKRAFAAVLAMLLLLSGCILRSTVEEGGVYVYRLRGDSSGSGNQTLCAEHAAVSEGESELDAAIRALNAQPEDTAMERVFPTGVEIEVCRLKNGKASVVMSDSYEELSELDRVLADYAVVYTLVRLDEVTEVDIICSGRVVRSGLRADGAVLADAEYAGCERIIKLFIPSGDGTGLVSRSVVVTENGEGDQAEVTVRELLKALEDVPDTTRLVSASIEGGVCTVNLSEEFYTTEPENVHTARLIIGSFIDTLTFLPSVEQVVIQVSGSPISSYGSYVTVWPAEFDGSLITYGG